MAFYDLGVLPSPSGGIPRAHFYLTVSRTSRDSLTRDSKGSEGVYLSCGSILLYESLGTLDCIGFSPL